ncbi:MAG: XdhC family protein [Gammaproteobacteria bacterium]
MRRADLELIDRARHGGRPLALVTDLRDGAQALVDAGSASGDLALAPAALEAVRERLRQDRSGRLEEVDAELFVRVHAAPLRLILIGAVHVAQALIPMAELLGYRVSVVDPRTAFATDLRFPRVLMHSAWPDAALKSLAPDRRTAVVTLTHDPKLDDPALAVALASEAFYIGALGSRRTHAARVQRLREAGFDGAAIARIHAPVGLPLGGRLPAEIAVAVLAEITQVLRAPPA